MMELLGMRNDEKDFLSFKFVAFNVTGPPGALLFDVKPEIALKKSLEL